MVLVRARLENCIELAILPQSHFVEFLVHRPSALVNVITNPPSDRMEYARIYAGVTNESWHCPAQIMVSHYSVCIGKLAIT
jgi:hypothetical protein